MSSEQAAIALGVSRSRFAQWVGQGAIVAVPVPVGYPPKGVRHFTIADVEALKSARARGRPITPKRATTSSGSEFTLKAFALFEQGASLATCIKELDAPIATVRKLYEEWKTPLGKKPPEKDPEAEERAREKEHDERMRAYETEAVERRKRHAANLKALTGAG